MNVNFNVEITEQTVPKAVIAKLREIREGLKLSGILAEDDKPRRIKNDSEERELRKEWTKVTKKPRFKTPDMDKLLIEQGKLTIEDVLKKAIEDWKRENPNVVYDSVPEKNKLSVPTVKVKEKKQLSHY